MIVYVILLPFPVNSQCLYATGMDTWQRKKASTKEVLFWGNRVGEWGREKDTQEHREISQWGEKLHTIPLVQQYFFGISQEQSLSWVRNLSYSFPLFLGSILTPKVSTHIPVQAGPAVSGCVLVYWFSDDEGRDSYSSLRNSNFPPEENRKEKLVIKKRRRHQICWHMPIIPATREDGGKRIISSRSV